ncbi:hypothetical protein Bca4012_053246 [Brassica carinata]|uniref:Uncharacterized protein n=1 Tax=Brassica carinata TaxID=52824 RepID=A0A8X7RCG3_BRACI|nr:hypothetical protein Bca52824_055795 [Brassica carinata]
MLGRLQVLLESRAQDQKIQMYVEHLSVMGLVAIGRGCENVTVKGLRTMMTDDVVK